MLGDRGLCQRQLGYEVARDTRATLREQPQDSKTNGVAHRFGHRGESLVVDRVVDPLRARLHARVTLELRLEIAHGLILNPRSTSIRRRRAPVAARDTLQDAFGVVVPVTSIGEAVQTMVLPVVECSSRR